MSVLIACTTCGAVKRLRNLSLTEKYTQSVCIGTCEAPTEHKKVYEV